MWTLILESKPITLDGLPTLPPYKKVSVNVKVLQLLHILQPLDISVFKPFKSFFNKACKKFLFSNPGQVIKSENLAHLYQSPGQKLCVL